MTLYQTQEDEKNEQMLFDKVEGYWPWVYFGWPLGKTCTLDRLGRNRKTDEILYVAEGRIRKKMGDRIARMYALPTFIINVGKVRAGLELSLVYGCPYIIIVGWTDFIGYVRVDGINPEWKVAPSKRWVVRCEADKQDVVHIPIGLFRVVGSNA